MPTYEYQCRECQGHFELRVSMKETRENVNCTLCQSSSVYRSFAGIQTRSDKQRATVPDIPMPGGTQHSHSCHSCRC